VGDLGVLFKKIYKFPVVVGQKKIKTNPKTPDANSKEV